MRYSGLIGFATTVEMAKGVWEDRIVKRRYFGDVLRHAARWEGGDSVNDNFHISNRLSLIGDGYLKENLGVIRFAEFMGTNWKVNEVEVNLPRIILTLGDKWNGPEA